MSVLAVLVCPDGRLRAGWAELVGAAGAAGQAAGTAVEALVVGGGPEDRMEEAARELGRLGAQKVWLAAHPALAEPDADRYVTALQEAVGAAGAALVLLNGDPFGAQLGPRLAMRLGAAPVTEVVGVQADGGGPAWIRPVYGGKAMAVVRPARERVVAVVRPRAFPAPPAREGQGPAGSVERVGLQEAPRLAVRVQVVERRAAASEGIRLEDARIVVSGGRGLGGPEGFEMLRQLAELLGAAVGASRAAVDAGWVPGTWQIGQTGKMVAPELYLAVGISGASQHLAGVSGARHIVAINTDPEAPIFRVAEVGLVEDYRKAVPLLVERLQQVLGRSPASRAG